MSSRSRLDNSRSVTKVYVGGLKEDIGNDQLQDEFERFGPIKTVWVARNPSSKGYAFVDYYDAGHALDAVKEMDGQFCFGSSLKVQLSRNELERDKERSSSRRRSEERYDRRDRSRGHTRSESPGSDKYDSRKSPSRRSNSRSPLPRRRSDSPESASQLPRSSDPLQLVDSALLRDSLLRNALTLLLLRDPLLLSASSSLGLNGVHQRGSDEDTSTRKRPRPYDRPEHPAHRQDVLRVLRESLSMDVGDILAQQAALQNFVLSQSPLGCLGMQAGGIPQIGLANPVPAPASSQQQIFPMPNNLAKPSSSTTPTESQSDWYLNRYYGYHLQSTPFTTTGSAMPPGLPSPASAHQMPEQQTTPTFPIRMPFSPSLSRPLRMNSQTHSTPTPVRPPTGHWRGPPPPNTSS